MFTITLFNTNRLILVFIPVYGIVIIAIWILCTQTCNYRIYVPHNCHKSAMLFAPILNDKLMEFSIAVFWLRGSEINGLLRGFAASEFAKLIIIFSSQQFCIHCLVCCHSWRYAYWWSSIWHLLKSAGSIKWTNNCRGLSSNPLVAKEEWTNSTFIDYRRDGCSDRPSLLNCYNSHCHT